MLVKLQVFAPKKSRDAERKNSGRTYLTFGQKMAENLR